MPLGILNNLNPVNRDNILATGLVSWYLGLPHFASGPLWQDLGLAQNTGTFTGSARWATSQRPGGYSAATTYDGTNSYVDATSILMPVGAGVPLTIAFWCRTNNLTGFRTPYFYGNNAVGRGVLFAQDGTSNDGTVDVGIVGSNFISSTKKLAVNVWTHLCLTYDGTTARLYFNGLLDSSAAVTLNPPGAGFNRIGSYIGSQFWSGDIDDVRMYWYGLTGTLVKELFDNSLQGCPGLLNFFQPQLFSFPPPPSTVTLPTFSQGPPAPGTPWFKFPALQLTSISVAPPIPPGTPTLTPFTEGPPGPGSPWFRNTPTLLNATPSQSAAQQAAMSNVPVLTPFTIGPPMKGAPWFKDLPAIPIDVRLPPPAPPRPPSFLPGFTAGPPIKGAPWHVSAVVVPVIPSNPRPPPVPPAGTPTTPAFTTGPPMPGSPWFQIPQAPGGNVPAAPVPAHGPGADFTLVQRDPTQEQPLRRFTEIIATIINSLVGQGILVQTKASAWTVNAPTQGLSGHFP